MSIQEDTFAEACFNQNSVIELQKALTLPADEADMKTWGLSEDEYFEQIKIALTELSGATPLCDRLNFSDKKECQSAIEVKKWHSVNHYETLCKYCADNDIDLSEINDLDFNNAGLIMADYGQENKATDSYFFWIDND